MRKPDDEKLWDTGTSNFEEGDKITFHNTEQGVEKTYTVKCVKENGDIELVYSVKKPKPPMQ
ncbi:hypothetical protein [Fictibacillus phosphorivorans]|uniref:hypothetical protein n=1 Tax=Fictibacillus phosphorivorans TaxID=1221500 RepID=UPI001293788A|nr:hypothetical protein [Fictibacillus phosphorivorans]MQR97259.1 hypothetical protein [Fictibacillus phosphorivorans]